MKALFRNKIFLLLSLMILILLTFLVSRLKMESKEQELLSFSKEISTEIYLFNSRNLEGGFEGFCQTGRWLEIKENLQKIKIAREKIKCIDRKNDFCIVVPSFKGGSYCLDRFKFKEFKFLTNHQCSNTNPACFAMNLAPKLILSAVPLIVKNGSPVALLWDSENVSACYWLEGLSEEAKIKGSINVFPSQKTTYLLKCDGPEGSVESSIIVKISEAN